MGRNEGIGEKTEWKDEEDKEQRSGNSEKNDGGEMEIEDEEIETDKG